MRDSQFTNVSYLLFSNMNVSCKNPALVEKRKRKLLAIQWINDKVINKTGSLNDNDLGEKPRLEGGESTATSPLPTRPDHDSILDHSTWTILLRHTYFAVQSPTNHILLEELIRLIAEFGGSSRQLFSVALQGCSRLAFGDLPTKIKGLEIPLSILPLLFSTISTHLSTQELEGEAQAVSLNLYCEFFQTINMFCSCPQSLTNYRPYIRDFITKAGTTSESAIVDIDEIDAKHHRLVHDFASLVHSSSHFPLDNSHHSHIISTISHFLRSLGLNRRQIDQVIHEECIRLSPIILFALAMSLSPPPPSSIANQSVHFNHPRLISNAFQVIDSITEQTLDFRIPNLCHHPILHFSLKQQLLNLYSSATSSSSTSLPWNQECLSNIRSLIRLVNRESPDFVAFTLEFEQTAQMLAHPRPPTHSPAAITRIHKQMMTKVESDADAILERAFDLFRVDM